MHLFVAIPALDELDYLPKTLQALEKQQTSCPFSVFVCVNQPDSWWNQADKKPVCENNRQLLFKLRRRFYSFPLQLIDKSSPGKGWDDKYWELPFGDNQLTANPNLVQHKGW